jgi:hypothetical protein
LHLSPLEPALGSPDLRRRSRQFKRVAQRITFVCVHPRTGRGAEQHKNREDTLFPTEDCELWTNFRDSAGPSLPINSAIGNIRFHPWTCDLFTTYSRPTAVVVRPRPLIASSGRRTQADTKGPLITLGSCGQFLKLTPGSDLGSKRAMPRRVRPRSRARRDHRTDRPALFPRRPPSAASYPCTETWPSDRHGVLSGSCRRAPAGFQLLFVVRFHSRAFWFLLIGFFIVQSSLWRAINSFLTFDKPVHQNRRRRKR